MAQSECALVNTWGRRRLEAITLDCNRQCKRLERARMILACVNGGPAQRIARQVEVIRAMVWRWQLHFAEEGVAALPHGKTRKPPISAATVARVVAPTRTAPLHQATHRTGCEHAVVRSADEKGHIQALGCAQPRPPLNPGRCGTMTHDYNRQGTTTLFEAKVDNYTTHKCPKVKEWLERHPRWAFQFASTSGPWLIADTNFFSRLTHKRIGGGSLHSLVDLQTAVSCHLSEHNAKPRSFAWKASVASTLAKLDRLLALPEGNEALVVISGLRQRA